MAIFDLEYTLCQIQSGTFSMAAKSHRQEGGDPKIEIVVTSAGTTWRLLNLDHGVPEVVSGSDRVDRVDFYFITSQLKTLLPVLPAAQGMHNPSLRLDPLSSVGTERSVGKRVRMAGPVCRFGPLSQVAILNRAVPAFDAVAADGTLHLDFETGPKRLYGHEIAEVHFGIQAEYSISPSGGPGPSSANIEMSNELYATILRELKYVL